MEVDAAAAVADWLQESKKIVVLTGVEISHEAGLPDFSDPRLNPNIRDFRENSEVRKEYWKKLTEVFPLIANIEPGPSHRALYELEMLVNLDCIFTQTTDGLHLRAGSSTVIELNSSLLWVNCTSCGKDYPMNEVLSVVEKGTEIPICTECGSDQIKPPISFPGQPLPHWEVREAWIRLHSADMFLIAGASLEHEPIASYPFQAKENEAKVVIISEHQSPADDYVDAVIYGKPGQVLTYILSKMKEAITIS